MANRETAGRLDTLAKRLETMDETLAKMVLQDGIQLAERTVDELNKAAGIKVNKKDVMYRWILDPNHTEDKCDNENTCEVNSKADVGHGVGIYPHDSLPEKVPPVHEGCFRSDTEVYTDEGWKYFYELKGYEKIYALNPETLEAEYVDYVDYIAYHYKGDMVRFSHRYMDFVVTLNHNKFILRRKRNWEKGKNYGKLIGYKSQLITAGELGKDFKEYQFYKSQVYNGGRDYVDLFGKRFDGKLFATFMGYYLSEGSVTKRGENRYQIAIAQSNESNKDLIYKTVKQLFKCSKNKVCVHIWVNTELAKYLFRFGKAHQKYIPQELKDLNKECLEAFVSAYVLGDGNVRKGNNYRGGKFSDSRHIYTSSKQMADDFTEIFLKLCKSVSFSLNARKGDKCVIRGKEYTLNHDVWQINELKKQTYHSDHITKSYYPYDDMVYGVTLSKWHVLLVRRKGNILWSGNCKCELESVYPENQDEVGWIYKITNRGFVFSSKSPDIERQLTGSPPNIKDGVIIEEGTDPQDYVTAILNTFQERLTKLVSKLLNRLVRGLK